MQSKITLENQSQEIIIIPKEGFEIDLENSDLKKGKVLFKEAKKKYPNAYFYCEKTDGLLTKTGLSPKYATKLSLLDTLLCLRDEYNRIDGFTEGFRIGEANWCISKFNHKLIFDKWSSNDKLIYFGKQETAEIFLNNFEEQLEQIKEFL